MFTELPPEILHACQAKLGASVLSVEFVGGGDINQARLLRTANGDFFLKMNEGPQAQKMFETEQRGLELLRSAGAIRIPEVIDLIDVGTHAGLLLEHIKTGYRATDFWEKFGRQLAALHRSTAPQFGLDYTNFIGSLPQPNGRHDTWAAFYQYERLQPQVDLANQSKMLNVSDLNNFEKLFKILPDRCPQEVPALTHGDLWSGNFLVSTDGEPVLIDPSVSFAHREMDLAMSRLFGGFDQAFYRSYEEAWALEPGFEKRLRIYQLYYLMVHVNLFGGGYVRSVRNILKEFI